MMKRFLYILCLLFIMYSCKKETFDYKVYEANAADIDFIAFSTGSPTLIADGKASLQFVIEAFRKVSLTTASGETKDSLMYVDYKSIPKEEVKVFINGQLIEGTTYTTKELSANVLECYVQIGNAVSEKKHVTILQPKDVGEQRYVDVVFHVLELNTTDEFYDPLTYQEITPKMLTEALAYANEIFNYKVGMDPNGGNAKVEFRLAKKNASGATLAISGYNRIQYDVSWKSNPILPYNLTNFTAKINSTAAYQWDKNKFLNIYVYPLAANSSLGDYKAKYQIVPAGETPVKGIANTINSESQIPTTSFHDTYGLGVHRSAFFPDPSNRIEIASYLATYYAIYPTHSAGASVEDYVSDTRKYLTGQFQTSNISTSLLKVGIDGQKFLANNAMDDLRYASLRNSLTQGQVERLRKVMEVSPVRKAWSRN